MTLAIYKIARNGLTLNEADAHRPTIALVRLGVTQTARPNLRPCEVACHAMSDMALGFYAYQPTPRYDAKRDRLAGPLPRSFTPYDPAAYARTAA